MMRFRFGKLHLITLFANLISQITVIKALKIQKKKKLKALRGFDTIKLINNLKTICLSGTPCC